MLRFSGDLERFPVGAVDDPLERLQGPPLGVVLPPDRKSHAGDGGSSVYKAEDWDAFKCELASDGWPYRVPNRGHLGLR